MKVAVFVAALIIGVPLMAYAARRSTSVRSWLLTLLILSTALGDLSNINFVSTEQYRGPDRGFEIAVSDLLAWALCLALITGARRRLSWVPFNSLWMAGLFLVAVISTALSSAPLVGAFSLFKMLRIYLVFWCVVNALRAGVDMRAVWRPLVALGVLLAVVALKQRYVDGIYRTPGLFDHPNAVPIYLNLVMPALLLRGVIDRRLGPVSSSASIVAAFGMLFAVYATFSRAGIVLAGAVLLAAVAVAALRVPSRRARVVAAVVVVLAMGASAKVAPHVVRRFQEAPPTSGTARVEFNQAAALMSRDSLFGVGLNNFSNALTHRQEFRNHLAVLADENPSGVCHHIYWLTVAEVGPLGLALFLVVMGRFLWLALWRGLRLRGADGAVLWGFALGFLTVHAVGVLEWAFRTTPVMTLFAVVCGACVAVAQPPRRADSWQRAPALGGPQPGGTR